MINAGRGGGGVGYKSTTSDFPLINSDVFILFENLGTGR